MFEIFDSKWPWQIRQLGEKNFLTRFPPHKLVKDMVDYPSINLKKKGVAIKVIAWEGGIESIGELQDIWVQVRGIPPKWCTWQVIAQIRASLGILLEVDSAEIFKSFYEVVRIKVVVKDVFKIPERRIMVMQKKIFLLDFTTEIEDSHLPQQQDDNEYDNNDDNADDLDEDNGTTEHQGSDRMETEQRGNSTPNDGKDTRPLVKKADGQSSGNGGVKTYADMYGQGFR